MTGSDIQAQNKDLKSENTFLCFFSSLKCPFDSIRLLAVGLKKNKKNFHCLPSKGAESAGIPVIATVAAVCGLGHVTNVLKEKSEQISELTQTAISDSSRVSRSFSYFGSAAEIEKCCSEKWKWNYAR